MGTTWLLNSFTLNFYVTFVHRPLQSLIGTRKYLLDTYLTELLHRCSSVVYLYTFRIQMNSFTHSKTPYPQLHYDSNIIRYSLVDHSKDIINAWYLTISMFTHILIHIYIPDNDFNISVRFYVFVWYTICISLMLIMIIVK